MEIAGIRFAPLKVPMDRRLQTLAAGVGFVWLIFGGFICLILSIYLVLFTKYWWITSIYLLWFVLWDIKVCRQGGRPSAWVRSWSFSWQSVKDGESMEPDKIILYFLVPFKNLVYRWWKYMKDYFPATLERLPWVELDPKKNYLFCCFPHGMLSLGVFCSFGNEYGEFKTYFPHHVPHVVTLSQHYIMPFFREMCLALGGISAEAEAIDYVLKYPNGGHVCVLMPGGAQESYYCKPGQYRIILKKRKGFVKLALKSGTSLVPVLSFGETDTFDQVEGENLRKIQEIIRKWIGLAPVVPVGRGFFQYSFGLVPRRKPICVVVGHPMEIPKIENPTPEQVDEYHSKYMEHLENMFEEQKHNYLEDPENKKLIIE